jgi:group I intron endonuclease
MVSRVVHYIYKVTNNINNGIYIGYTSKSIERRWKQHIQWSRKQAPKTLIHKVIAKYGSENFTVECLLETEDQDEALAAEIQYIAELQTNRNRWPDGNGYNLADGGRLSPATRGRKIPNRKKYKMTDEHKANIAKGGRGRKRSPETKERIRQTLTGKAHAPERREKAATNAATRRGKTLTELYGADRAESILAAITEAGTGRKQPDESIERSRLSKLGAGRAIKLPEKSRCRCTIEVTFVNGSVETFNSVARATAGLGYSRSFVDGMLKGTSRLAPNITAIMRR